MLVNALEHRQVSLLDVECYVLGVIVAALLWPCALLQVLQQHAQLLLSRYTPLLHAGCFCQQQFETSLVTPDDGLLE